MGKMALMENQELLGGMVFLGGTVLLGGTESPERKGNRDFLGGTDSPERGGNRDLLDQEVEESPMSVGARIRAQIYQEQKEYTKVGLLEASTHTQEEVATTSASQRSPRTLILVLELWMHLTFMGWNIKCLAIYQVETIT